MPSTALAAPIPPDEETEILAPLTDQQRIRVLEAGHRLLIEQVAEIGGRLQKGDRRMGAIETDLKLNTSTTLEIRDLLTAAKGAFRVLGWIGVGVKWVGGLAATAVGVWSLIDLIRNGHK